ncbi:Zn-ribbon containing protein [Natronoarchaeum mannanilyticum]|uniref:OapC/ArvC family zinc-ribbon domain-containing protein n=1 Tax=Natronoarchaeum mannanilyticum TaxID=926360 RepID=UPI003611C841
MPHQCTNCGRTFPDGSKEMLSGCPDCGGNKFQFEPSGGGSVGANTSAGSADATAASDSTADASASNEASDSDSSSDSGVSGTVSQAKQTVSDWVGRGDSSSAEDAATASAADDASTEDDASASAENAASASTRDATSASADDRAGSDAAERSSASPDSASPRQDAGSPLGASEPSLADAREDADAGRSNIESTGDWPDVGSRDPTDDPTRSGDHPSRPDDRPSRQSRPDDRPTPSDDDLTRTPGNDADTSPSSSSEDVAQASARSDVVDPNDLPADDTADAATADGTAAGGSDTSDHPIDGDRSGTPPDADNGEVVGTPDDEQPDLEALRQELNEQFESIKIVRPGEYELNLMELYDRDEYIISLMEDGRYAIEVPDAWRDGE